MHSDDTEYTDLGMSVIKDLAPEVYDAITADDTWQVHVVDSPDQLTGPNWQDPRERHMIFGGGGYGATSVSADITERVTWLPRPTIRDLSASVGVAESHIIADALVHEFDHHYTGNGEVSAYSSALAIDRLMGDRMLIGNAEKNLMMAILGY